MAMQSAPQRQSMYPDKDLGELLDYPHTPSDYHRQVFPVFINIYC